MQGAAFSVPSWSACLLCGALVGTLAACGGPSAEVRVRDAAEKVRASLNNVGAAATSQSAGTSAVKAAQTQLAVLNEYQGEINGVLDSVTINAIEAFQRSQGLPVDGVLNERTREHLRAAVAARRTANRAPG